MEIKKLANNALNFSINRFIEILAMVIVLCGIFVFTSLISYSPDDPNFIFPDNTKINNLLGFRGSFTADLFFQSFGLISFLVPLSLIFTGINIFRNKMILLILGSLFYSLLYSLIGSLFFSFFHSETFKLYVNGNGGFVGKYLETTFLINLININSQFFYFLLIFIISVLFLISIQFKVNSFYLFTKKFFNFHKLMN